MTETRSPATEAPHEKEYARLVGSTFSLRVIAGAIILLFAYYAQGVVITLVLSILLAYCLDPVVEFLERWRVPRTIGSMVMVLLLCAVIGAVGYGLWSRVSDFAESWPKYSGAWRQTVASIESKISGIERGVSGAAATPPGNQPTPQYEPSRSSEVVRTLILRGMGSLYALFLEITFVPFLVFFMLALTKWQAIGWFLLIAGVLTGIHIFALNLIAPQLVGKRLRLNAVAITIALLFWGWVWGGMGLLLAIPITATLRVFCEHTESWKPVGRWLSA